jgi:hypothetical protein
MHRFTLPLLCVVGSVLTYWAGSALAEDPPAPCWVGSTSPPHPNCGTCEGYDCPGCDDGTCPGSTKICFPNTAYSLENQDGYLSIVGANLHCFAIYQCKAASGSNCEPPEIGCVKDDWHVQWSKTYFPSPVASGDCPPKAGP